MILLLIEINNISIKHTYYKLTQTDQQYGITIHESDVFLRTII